MQNMTEEQRIKWRFNRFLNYTIKKMYSKERIEQIEKNFYRGLYIENQFIDADPNLTPYEYSRWFKNAKNSFFNTVQANELLLGKDYRHIERFHSPEDELSMPVLELYTVNQIMEALKYLDVYTMMLLLADDVKPEIIGKGGYFWAENIFITGIQQKEDGSHVKIASRPLFGGSSITEIDKEGKVVHNYKNAREFTYNEFRLPIYVILNSIYEAIDPYKLPNEGLDRAPFDEELCSKIRSIRLGDSYNQLVEKTNAL